MLNVFLYSLTECLCSTGATNSSCDQDTGECFCQEGAAGDKCDTCLPYYSDKGDGCELCSECVLGLRDTNIALSSTLDSVDVLQSTAEDLQNADTLDLEYFAQKVIEVLDCITTLNESLLAHKIQEGNLTAQYNNLDGNLQDLQNNVSY